LDSINSIIVCIASINVTINSHIVRVSLVVASLGFLSEALSNCPRNIITSLTLRVKICLTGAELLLSAGGFSFRPLRGGGVGCCQQGCQEEGCHHQERRSRVVNGHNSNMKWRRMPFQMN
jgi:hypothetical protein